MYRFKTKEKPVYLFDIATGESRNSVYSDALLRDPEELGMSYLPENSTYEKPPTRSGFVAVRIRNDPAEAWHPERDSWELVRDYRGHVFYDPETQTSHRITELGEQPQPGWVAIDAA